MSYGWDLKMTLDDLRSTFWTFLKFDLKWIFNLYLTPPWWPLGQRLFMDQIWSTWGQGLTSYAWPRNDLWWPQVNFLNVFEIWPQMTFWPWPDPTMMTPGSKAIHGPNLVHVRSRVNELWPWPRMTSGKLFDYFWDLTSNDLLTLTTPIKFRSAPQNPSCHQVSSP